MKTVNTLPQLDSLTESYIIDDDTDYRYSMLTTIYYHIDIDVIVGQLLEELSVLEQTTKE